MKSISICLVVGGGVCLKVDYHCTNSFTAIAKLPPLKMVPFSLKEVRGKKVNLVRARSNVLEFHKRGRADYFHQFGFQ